MGAYKISEEAKNDIAKLYEYGIVSFGLTQAQSYVMNMHYQFQKLANDSYIGRTASEFSEGLFWFNYKSHVIFYNHLNTDVYVVRVLSQRADLKQYF